MESPQRKAAQQYLDDNVGRAPLSKEETLTKFLLGFLRVGLAVSLLLGIIFKLCLRWHLILFP